MPTPSKHTERGASRKPVRSRNKPPKPEVVSREVAIGDGWDAIDEAGWESFPASDPPARWAGPDSSPQTEDAPEEVDEAPDDVDP